MLEGAGADPGLPAKGERTMKSSFRAIRLLVVAAALFLVVGAASLANAGSQAKVTINVAALRPGRSADAQKQFDDNVQADYRPSLPCRSPTHARLASTARSPTSRPA